MLMAGIQVLAGQGAEVQVQLETALMALQIRAVAVEALVVAALLVLQAVLGLLLFLIQTYMRRRHLQQVHQL
jgi:hypothetical protein